MAVARVNDRGLTVSKVAMAPLEIEYGRGQSRIMHRSLRPSCFRTKESAVNLVSVSTSLWTNLESNVLETTNEQNDPATVADAAMNQLAFLVNLCYGIILDIGYEGGRRIVSPIWEPEDETRDSQTRRIADQRGKGDGKDHCPEDQPSSSQIFPLFRERFQPCENSLIENEKQYSQPS